MKIDRYLGQFRPGFSRLHEDPDLHWIVPFAPPLTLGLVGERYSGVTTVAGYLEKQHGFRVYSLWDELRSIAEERGIPILARSDLQRLGDEIRYEYKDTAVLSRQMLRRLRRDRVAAGPLEANKNVVVTGIKHVSDLRVLARLHSFHLTHVIVPDDSEGIIRRKRVEASGMLSMEYGAERRYSHHHASGEDMAPWGKLSDKQRAEYLAKLDRCHSEGDRSGRYPDGYVSVPGTVIANAQTILGEAQNSNVHYGPAARPTNEASRLHELQNLTQDLDKLHTEVDQLLNRLRPPQHVVRH